MSDFLTVKEFSEAAGVSTQRIYKLVQGDLSEYAKKEHGKTLINSEALVFFKTVAKLQPSETAVNQETNADGCKVATQTVANLQPSETLTAEVVEMLRDELRAKDKQIADLMQQNRELTAALTDISQALRAAQALHAGTMQKQLQEPEPDAQTEAEQEPEPEHLPDPEPEPTAAGSPSEHGTQTEAGGSTEPTAAAPSSDAVQRVEISGDNHTDIDYSMYVPSEPIPLQREAGESLSPKPRGVLGWLRSVFRKQ